MIRFIPSLPGLIYAAQKDTLYVNLFASNKAEVKLEKSRLKIEQHTEYPWNGTVTIMIDPDKSQRFTLKLRIPAWVQNKVLPGDLYWYSHVPKGTVTIALNGKEVEYDTDRGYAAITRTWQKGDRVDIHFPMNVRRVVANEKVKDDVNLTALECGPMVYCVEGIDNEDRVDDLTIPDAAVLHLEKRNDLLGGVNVITGNVRSKDGTKELKLSAIPYYAWSNRGPGTMKVWLPRTSF